MKQFNVSYPKENMTSGLLMTPLGRNLYRLEESELFLEEPLYFHDVILARRRLGPGLEFKQLIEKSGLESCDFTMSQKTANSEELQALLGWIKDEGGCWEIMFAGVLIVHLPPGLMPDLDRRIRILPT